MLLERVELRFVDLPLVKPFRTSFGTEFARQAMIVTSHTSVGIGYGECVAGREPLYSSEHVAGADLVLTDFLIPRLRAAGEFDIEDVPNIVRPIRGHFMAKAALEMSLLDAHLRHLGLSYAQYLGSTRSTVPSGVSVGIPTDNRIDSLLTEVSEYVEAGYVRIKLKIQPGWDVEPVRAVRSAWPTVPLQVDANQAYTRADGDVLAQLDPFDLLLIEQPLAEEDVVGHAELRRHMATPMCLDESVTSLEVAEQILDLHACDIINIKPGRVGGYLEARKIHDLCVEREVPVWCGGMLETGIGRAANIALASLPGFTVVGDISESARFYAQDITEPFVLKNGHIDVPVGPGFGVEPLIEVMDSLTTQKKMVS
jgi:O-succinylbenzoate synthase